MGPCRCATTRATTAHCQWSLAHTVHTQQASRAATSTTKTKRHLLSIRVHSNHLGDRKTRGQLYTRSQMSKSPRQTNTHTEREWERWRERVQKYIARLRCKIIIPWNSTTEWVVSCETRRRCRRRWLRCWAVRPELDNSKKNNPVQVAERVEHQFFGERRGRRGPTEGFCGVVRGWLLVSGTKNRTRTTDGVESRRRRESRVSAKCTTTYNC